MEVRSCQTVAQPTVQLSLSVAHQSPTMTDRPIVPSETRKRRNEAREKLASEVDNLAEAFMTTLDSLAETHGWCVSVSVTIWCCSECIPPFFSQQAFLCP
jgi:hypothetical protein